ncbi:hypothetical protein F5Y10DRAFT_294252 [Nemania abortiva]|nr:hypothetical protein F5Y10DRAFT_294252 [Nemania abortiva]
MPNPTLIQAHQEGTSVHELADRSVAPVAALSGGAIAAIAAAGSVALFILLIGPLLIYLAKRRERHSSASCPVSSLAFVEHGQLANEDDLNIPRRLRKKSTASEPPMYLGMGDADSDENEGRHGGRMKVARHLSLPIVPTVFSRSKGLGFGDPSIGSVSGTSSNGRSNRSRSKTRSHGEKNNGSPEKNRGHIIYQNRRKTSWIDEDALHGPRISPKKKAAKASRWFTGNGLTRTLSRHLSFRGHRAPELARSPTLPYTETSKGSEFVGKSPAKSLEVQGTGSTGNARRMREFQAEIDIEQQQQQQPRFPVRQPAHEGGSMNIQVINTGPQAFPIPTAGFTFPQSQNDAAMNAAEQLAGRARVPYLDVGANAQRYPGIQESNTDAELQAILRRTAERLQDGNRSARRQTLMMPTSSSASRLQNRTRWGSNQECSCGREHPPTAELPPSPAKSQRSAPAELEGSSPGARQSMSQNGAPWQTHRRTHTQRISHISMISEPDSLAATPSRRGSQADGIHTALSSPSRMAQTSPSYQQQVLIQRSYTPVSDQSSALSTVYSEEEGTPSILKLDDDVPKRDGKMERTAIAQALSPRTTDYTENDGGRQTQANFQMNQSPSPRYRHTRYGTLGQISLNGNKNSSEVASPRQDDLRQPTARPSPKAMSRYTLEALQSATSDDPFTTCATTPKQATPQRLSQIFSPLPSATETPSATAEDDHGTPTPSPSRKRVLPPPHRLCPDSNSPTLGHYHDAQPAIQPPSREPSPAASESGLSSVYDSYRYSRYSFEGSQAALARLSTGTMLTVPPTEASPGKSSVARWGEEVSPATSTESRMEGPEMEVAGLYTHPHLASPSMATSIGHALDDAQPHAHGIRDVSLGGMSAFSASAYSQDGEDGEDGEDRLAPLVPFHSGAGASVGRRTMRVTSAVAELRRMNSQISCVSGYSTATTNVGDGGDIASPSLPTLLSGPSGNKRGKGGARNYLSLGRSLASRREEEEAPPVPEIREDIVAGMAMGSGSGSAQAEATVPRANFARSRRHTVVESFEQDLHRARQSLRENRGYSVQGISEISNKGLGSGGLMIRTAESR